MKAHELVIGKTYMVKVEKKTKTDDGFRPMEYVEHRAKRIWRGKISEDFIFNKPNKPHTFENDWWLLRRELAAKVREISTPEDEVAAMVAQHGEAWTKKEMKRRFKLLNTLPGFAELAVRS